MFLITILSFPIYGKTIPQRLLDIESELTVIKKKRGAASVPYAEALFRKAWILADADSVDYAIRIGTDATEIIRQKQGADSHEYGKALVQLALLYATRKDYGSCKPLMEDGSRILRETVGVSHIDYSKVRLYEATQFFAEGDYGRAAESYREIASVYRNSGDAEYEKDAYSAEMLVYLSEIYAKKKTRVPVAEIRIIGDECIRHYGEDSIDYAQFLFFCGNLYLYCMQYEDAYNCFSKAVPIMELNISRASLKYVKCVARLINTQLLTQRNLEADKLINATLKDCRSVGAGESWWKEGERLILLYKGISLLDKRLYDDALTALNNVYLNEPIGSELRDDATVQLMRLYLLVGNSQRAIDFCDELLYRHSARSNLVMTRRYYMLMLYKMEALMMWNPEAALSHGISILNSVRQNMSSGKEHMFDSIMSGLCIMMAKCALMYGISTNDREWLDVFPDFIAQYETTAGNVNSSLDKRETAALKALYAIAAKDGTSAMRYLEEFFGFLKEKASKVFPLIPSSKRNDYWSSNQPLFDWLVPVVGKMLPESDEYNRLWLETSLFNKGLMLEADISLRREFIKSSGELIINLGIAEENLSSAIASGARRADVDSLVRIRDDAETELLHDSKVMKCLRSHGVADLNTLCRRLSTGECAVEFVSFVSPDDNNLLVSNSADEECYIAFVILPDGRIRRIQLPSLYEIASGAIDLKMIQDKVWKPLGKALRCVKRIYFSPSGVLNVLPIEYCYPDKKVEVMRMSHLSNIKKEREHASIVKAMLFGGLDFENGDVLAEDNLSDNSDFARIGNIVLSGDLRAGVDYLPGSLAEVRNIEGVMRQKGIVSELVTGSAGTEEKLKTVSGKRMDILHIATHGFYYERGTEREATRQLFKMFKSAEGLSLMEMSMIRSGLLMSGVNRKLKRNVADGSGNREDGVLTAREISMLDLSGVDLVVLSACQTGLGELHPEGVLGLQRAFKLAGVNTILMSLWKVDDEATRLLMEHFYDGMLDGKSKSESLKAARETLRKQERYKDPHFWASFILLDDF